MSKGYRDGMRMIESTGWKGFLGICVVLVVAGCNAAPARPAMTAAPVAPALTATPAASTAAAAIPTHTKIPEPSATPQDKHTRPVDANDDGVIDADDVLILMDLSNEHWEKKIMPLLKKAGVETDEDGNVVSKDATTKIKENLSVEEQNDLDMALREYEKYSLEVDATLLEAYQNR